MRAAPIQTAFNNGEVSPYLYGRVDLDKSALSLRECTNSVPLPQGPQTKRDGSQFVCAAANEAETSAFIEFEFNASQSYLIELNSTCLRFITNRGLVLEAAKAVTGITQANPAVVTINSHGWSNGDQVTLVALGPYGQLVNRVFTVAGATTNTFQLAGFDGTSLPAFSGSPTMSRVYSIASPYAAGETRAVMYTQSADVIYLFHKAHVPKLLARAGATNWSITDFVFQDGPYLTLNVTATTLTPSAVSGSVTLTASATTGINGGSGFVSTDVGRHIRIQGSDNKWTWAVITAVSSSTVVTATIKGAALPNTNARTTWRLGLYSDTTGWPSAGVFYKDRFIMTGPRLYPYFLAASQSGVYDTFSPTEADGTVTAADGFAYALLEQQVSAINWLAVDEKGIIAGTNAGEAVIRKATTTEAFSALNIEVDWPTHYGSEPIRPAVADAATLFVQRTGKRVREYAYVYENDSFRAPNMSVMADHITGDGLTRIALQNFPRGILWGARADGVLIGMTYEREQNVIAWHKHPLGGANAVVEDVAVIPSPDGKSEDVWLLVARTIGGVTRRYIEFIGDYFEHTTDQRYAVFSDCALMYEGAPTTSIAGLWHLAGETVRVLVDGNEIARQVVSFAGTITLPYAGSVVVIGLPYKMRLWTLPLNAGAGNGTSQGKIKRVWGLVLRLYRALGGVFGGATGSLSTIPYRTIDQSVTKTLPLFSGDTRRLNSPMGWEKDGGIVIENDTAYPFTLLAAMPRVDTEDEG